MRGKELGETVQLAAEVEGQIGGEGELLELGAGELVTLLPLLVLMPPPQSAAAFALTDLLQPEARRRRVEHPQQRQVLVLARPSGSLITGADCLNTLPPRSSTKWLCVATNANTIDNGVE